MTDAPNYGARRIAVTPEQIAEHDLPTKPRKATNRRSLQSAQAFEAEAMPVGVMRRIHRSEIEELLPPWALQIARAAERSERRHLLRIANFVRGSE